MAAHLHEAEAELKHVPVHTGGEAGRTPRTDRESRLGAAGPGHAEGPGKILRALWLIVLRNQYMPNRKSMKLKIATKF